MKAWASLTYLLITLIASWDANALTWEYQMNQAWEAYRLGSITKALEFAEHAMQYARNAPNKEQIARTCIALGNLHRIQGDFKQAEALTAEGLSISESLPDPDHEDIASARIHLAKLYIQLARLEEADALLKRTLTDALKELGLQHRLTAAAMAYKGKLLALKKKYSSAEFWYLQAMRSGAQSFTGTSDENFSAAGIGGDLLFGLAYVYQKQQRFDEALEISEKLLQAAEKNWGAKHPLVADSLFRIGSILVEEERYENAEISIRQALEIMEHSVVASSPLAANCLALLAKLYIMTDRSALARPLIERAIAIAEQVYPSGHQIIKEYRELLRAIRSVDHDRRAEDASQR